IHGWAVSGRVWKPILDRWPAGAGKVLAPDLRGTGWSSKPREGYGIDDYAGDISRLIDTLGLRDLALVGHSMGGTIAQRVALQRGAALRRLVLVSPVPASGVPFDEGQLAFFRSLGGHRAGAEQTLGMMMARPCDPDLFDRTVECMATVVPEAFFGGFDAWRSANFADEIGAISTPTVVMGGAVEQPLSPEVLQAAVVALIPGAQFVAIEGTSHYPQLECADEFMALLQRAITGDAAAT
ncbi:MAG: alpha/beta hydrolase, partial [Nannocystaceae bacterium]